MKWRFWEKKKEKVEIEKTKKKEPTYDEELEKFLEQSQLHPYLQEGLQIINRAINGEISFYPDMHIEKELKDCKIDFWYISSDSIRLSVYNKDYDKILYMNASYI